MAESTEAGTSDIGNDHDGNDSLKVKGRNFTKEGGVASIKPQYIDYEHKRTVEQKYLTKEAVEEIKKVTSESDKTESIDINENGASESTEPPKKKIKLKGRNKKRPQDKRPDNKDKLCPSIVEERECMFGDNCKFCHDLERFMKQKAKPMGDNCYLYDTFGKCWFGISCLNSNQHTCGENYKQIINKEKWDKVQKSNQTSNLLPKDVQTKLWKRKYDFHQALKVAKSVEKGRECDFNDIVVQRPSFYTDKYKNNSNEITVKNSEFNLPSQNQDINRECGNKDASEEIILKDKIVNSNSEDDMVIKLRPQEKRKVTFKDQLYLAPLTTVGNLPFRRICKKFGVDITCSEMATATGLLQGHKSEWALLRRHHTEDVFGVQVAGAYPDLMTKTAQVIMENTDVDFIDINCGCPIDLFYKKGEGCGLMAKTTKLYNIVRSMQTVMDVPLTVKLRTGIFEGKNIANRIISSLKDLKVSMVTLHGRSREQRYTKLADWDFINQCSQEAAPMPLFGNGDIMSYEDYNTQRQNTGVAGCMIARGALMKPWVFTEIKEQRHWDISSGERLDMLKDFVNFGLEHWGSDIQGVQTTRRFLLEWLSFLYRYIPVGLLERLPQKIHEKPPYYFGRNDLETLMASPNCADWIKISEMLLGPVPDNFQFLPKHKANSYQ